MSWRDKVQSMRAGKISQKCLAPSLPKPPKPSSVSFGTPPPAPFPKKIGFSGHEAKASDTAAPELKTQPSAAPPVPDKPARPAKQTFIELVDAWRELDQAYQRHHFNCPTCIAAGKGYGLRCETGFVLWKAYSDASCA